MNNNKTAVNSHLTLILLNVMSWPSDCFWMFNFNTVCENTEGVNEFGSTILIKILISNSETSSVESYDCKVNSP